MIITYHGIFFITVLCRLSTQNYATKETLSVTDLTANVLANYKPDRGNIFNVSVTKYGVAGV